MTPAEITEIDARIDKGVRLLNERYPGWPAKINVDQLDMHSGWNCVLAQLFGDDLKGCSVLRLGGYQEFTFGFNLHSRDEECGLKHDAFTEIWRSVVKKLQWWEKEIR